MVRVVAMVVRQGRGHLVFVTVSWPPMSLQQKLTQSPDFAAEFRSTPFYNFGAGHD
jgi:hypothetical protein